MTNYCIDLLATKLFGTSPEKLTSAMYPIYHQTMSTVSCQIALNNLDRIPSTNPGAEPPRDARDSGSARSHSTHLETSSSDRPEMVTHMESQTVPTYMSLTCTRRTLRIPNFTLAPHAQPSLSNIPKWDSNFGELTH